MIIEDLSKSQLGRYFKIENEPSNLQSNISLKSIYLMKLFHFKKKPLCKIHLLKMNRLLEIFQIYTF